MKRVVDKRAEYEKSFVGYKALFEKVKEKEEEIQDIEVAEPEEQALAEILAEEFNSDLEEGEILE